MDRFRLEKEYENILWSFSDKENPEEYILKSLEQAFVWLEGTLDIRLSPNQKVDVRWYFEDLFVSFVDEFIDDEQGEAVDKFLNLDFLKEVLIALVDLYDTGRIEGLSDSEISKIKDYVAGEYVEEV